jgi:hypothetical protein
MIRIEPYEFEARIDCPSTHPQGYHWIRADSHGDRWRAVRTPNQTKAMVLECGGNGSDQNRPKQTPPKRLYIYSRKETYYHTPVVHGS